MVEAAERVRIATRVPLKQEVAMNGTPDDVFGAMDLYGLYGLADHPVIAGYLQGLKDKATSKIINDKAKYTEHLAHFAGKRSLESHDLRPDASDNHTDTVADGIIHSRPNRTDPTDNVPVERLFRYVDVTKESERLAVPVPLSPPASAGVPAVTAGRPESGSGHSEEDTG